jgi:hypothetical protein
MDRKRHMVARKHVPPSSGDCARGLDQNLPTSGEWKVASRCQHPKVIENSNRHGPTWLIKSANGSRANRADDAWGSQENGVMTGHRRGPACHSLATNYVALEPPVKATLRLACSLRSQRSALTGPGSNAGPISEMREWQASTPG